MYILFFLCWIIFNGQLTVEIGIIGIFVAALLYAFICKFMGWSFRKDIHMMQYAIFMVGYLFVLIWEIIKANFDTMKMIFTSKYEREPVLVTFRTKIKSPVLRVLLANSITLTPGTITVSLEDDTSSISSNAVRSVCVFFVRAWSMQVTSSAQLSPSMYGVSSMMRCTSSMRASSLELR